DSISSSELASDSGPSGTPASSACAPQISPAHRRCCDISPTASPHEPPEKSSLSVPHNTPSRGCVRRHCASRSSLLKLVLWVSAAPAENWFWGGARPPGPTPTRPPPPPPQAQRVADHADRGQRHRSRRDDRRQRDSEPGIEHAGRDRHARRVVDEGEEQILAD